MKLKLLLLPFFIYFLFNQSVFAQNCFDITFETQQEIDDFAINFPNCNQINGRLTIEEQSSGEITSLSGLSQITSILDGLHIMNNDSLKTLEGLENVNFVRENIQVINNATLHSISAFQRQAFDRISALFVYNNSSLSLCNEPAICHYIFTGGGAGGTGIAQFFNNVLGCNSLAQVVASCRRRSKINYQIYYDMNQNKIREIDEPIYPEAGIKIEPGGNIYFSGQVEGPSVLLDRDTYEIAYNSDLAPNWELTTDSLSYHLTLMDTTSCDTLYFGLFPKFNIPKLITLINTPPLRCNTSASLDVAAINLGTTITSGTLWWEANSTLDSLRFNSPPDTITASNRYGWFFENLPPGHRFRQQIEIGVPGPPDISVGDLLSLTSYTDYSDSNDDYQSEKIEYTEIIPCSYTPNDKLVYPNRDDNITLFDEDLIYTIRFQNTGYPEAIDILILDTLDTYLDPSSFRVLSTSHPKSLLTSLEADRYLAFNFSNILLPSSLVDFEGSHGYISYMIKPLDGLEEQTKIYNTASIYFDQKPPIVTNTTENILVSGITSAFESEEVSIRLFPNPTSEQVYLHSSQDFDGMIELLDLSGRRVMQRVVKGNTEIDLSQQNKGIYFLKLKIGKPVCHGKDY